MKKKYYIDRKTIIYALSIIPFIWLEYFEIKFPLVSNFFDILKFLIMFYLFLFSLKHKKISKVLFIIAIYFLTIIGITFWNNLNVTGILNVGLNTFFFCLLTDYLLKKDVKKTISAFSFIYQLLVIINFLTMIIFPQGIYSTPSHPINWFLGYKNSHILYVLNAMFFISLFYLKNKKHIDLYYVLFLLISGITIFLGGSSTGIIGYLLFIIGIFFIIRKKANFIVASRMIKINIGVFFAIVIFRLQNYFIYLIQIILKKNLSFTGRTAIWDKTINLIKKDFWLGHGVQPSSTRIRIYNNINAVNSHNQILEIFYNGGLFLGIQFIYLIYIVVRKLMKNKLHDISKLGTLVLFTYLVMMLMESYRYNLFMYLFVILYNIELIIFNKEME